MSGSEGDGMTKTDKGEWQGCASTIIIVTCLKAKEGYLLKCICEGGLQAEAQQPMLVCVPRGSLSLCTCHALP